MHSKKTTMCMACYRLHNTYDCVFAHMYKNISFPYFSINYIRLITLAASCEELDDKETGVVSTLPFTVYPLYVQTYVKI